MFTRSIRAFAGALAMTCALAVGGAAHATIVNIDATNATGTTFVFAGGSDYLIEFIGTADGGAFNGWNASCPAGVCGALGWRETFNISVNGSAQLEVFSIPGPTFSSALAALAAFQAAPNIVDNTLELVGGFYQSTGQDLIPQPWIVHPDVATSVQFFIRDQTYGDNLGGVSLRITAAPEPATWLMLILGLGSIGALARARRTPRPALT